MFTGLIEETGTINEIRSAPFGRIFSIMAGKVLEDLNPEDSIAVNGVCLTVTRREQRFFQCDAVTETLNRSTLSMIKKGTKVNLERSMRLGGRFGGHLVQGHIDCIGHIHKIDRKDSQWDIFVELPADLMKYTVIKGSVAVDGMSLTIASIDRNSVRLAIIPYTLEHTLVTDYAAGIRVNIEVDLIGKYIERLLKNQRQSEGRDASFYKSHGF